MRSTGGLKTPAITHALVTVFDRPKTIAFRWGRDGVVTEWNPTFAGVVLDLGKVGRMKGLLVDRM